LEIDAYCENNSLTYQQFADLIGVTYRTVYDWMKGNKAPSEHNIAKLKEVLGLAEHEILGKEPPLLPAPLPDVFEFHITWNAGKLTEDSPPPDDEFLAVPVLDPDHVVLVGGSPQINSREQIVGHAIIHRRIVGRKKSADGLYCLSVKKDSMEPILREGAIVCVDTNIMPETAPSPKSMWAVQVDEGTVVKYLQINDSELWLLSENCRKHPPKKAKASDKVIGKVIWSWQSH